MTSNNTFTAVVPAAGIGKRMGAECAKQYLVIAGKTILEHTLGKLIAHPQIARVIVVIHPQDKQFSTLAIANSPWLTTVLGGEERSDSVLAGLHHVNTDEYWVLVHDAARPCIHQKDLSKLFQLAEKGKTGGILATPVRDTMKRSNEMQQVLKTESRDNLWHAMTPQFFPLDELKTALQTAQLQKVAITDEASAIEFMGGRVNLVEGRASNLKITQAEDLQLATYYLTQANTVELT